MRRLVGCGWRPWLARWIDSGELAVDCLELTAEHFFDHPKALDKLRGRWPLYVHGLGLSLGTPGPLDADTLKQFTKIAALADAAWVSEHVAFTKTAEVDLGHLNPVALTEASLDTLVAHASELKQRTGRPLILENISSHIPPVGDLRETEFLSQLCERADCGLLLDVTNLYINSRNHGYDPRAWLHELDPRRIVQLHIVGYTETDTLEDTHGAVIQPEIIELLGAVLEYGDVQAVILERDDPGASLAELQSELARLREACDA